MKAKKTKEKKSNTWYSDRMDEIVRQLWAGEYPLGRWEKQVAKGYQAREEMISETWRRCKAAKVYDMNLPEPWIAYEKLEADELHLDENWKSYMSTIFGYIAAKETDREYKGKKAKEALIPSEYFLDTRSPDGIHKTLDSLNTKAAYKIIGAFTMVKWEGGPEFRISTESQTVTNARLRGSKITKEEYDNFGKDGFARNVTIEKPGKELAKRGFQVKVRYIKGKGVVFKLEDRE